MKFRVRDSLLYGRENAIPSKTLAQNLGFRSVRDLQKTVELERAAGAVILCDSQGAGSGEPKQAVFKMPLLGKLVFFLPENHPLSVIQLDPVQ